MRTLIACVFMLLCTGNAAVMLGQAKISQTDEAAIRAAMEQSAKDWNRGDMESFAKAYKNSPDILIVGPSNHRGYQAMLDSYRKNYATPEARGVLSFSGFEVQPLDERFATATGHFHLQRNMAGGGNADGYYLLVFEKTAGGWKIVRDLSVQTTKGK